MKKKSSTKKALAFIKGGDATYTERSDIAKREAVAVLMKRGIERYEFGKSLAIEGAKCFVRSANAIVEAGDCFDEAEKTSQHEFKAFSTDMEGWARDYERKLKIKAAQKVARILEDQKVENLEQATPVLHQICLLSGQVEELRRLGGETAHEPLNPFNAFISTAATVETWLKKLEPPESPVETFYASCKVETLQKIEMATRPMAERHAIVEKLLKEKSE